MDNSNKTSKQLLLERKQALNLAIKNHGAGNLSEAETIYREILSKDPNNPEALNLLGVLADQAGQKETAINLIKKAIDFKPGFSNAYNNLGFTLQSLGRLDEATENYQKAISFNPELVEAYYNLGNTLKESGNVNESVNSYKKAIALKPDYIQAYCNLGNLLSELGILDEALLTFQNAVKIKNNDADILYNYGNLLKKFGRIDEAIFHYNKVLSARPKFLEAYVNLGNAHHDLGNLKKALSNYHQALTIQPDYAEILLNIGIILLEQGYTSDAVTKYKEALDLKPDSDECYLNIRLAILPMYYEVLTQQRKLSSIERLINHLNKPPEPEIVGLQLELLTSPSAINNWEKVISKLSNVENETFLNKNVKFSTLKENNDRARQIVALLHFGRSGSGYLHSLLDNHPNVSTMPGIYLSGFFGRKVWQYLTRKNFKKVPSRLSSLYKVLFDARNPDRIPPPFVGDTYTNDSVGFKEGFVRMGENQDTPLALDQALFEENIRNIIDCRKHINHGELFEAIHHAYEITLGNNFTDKHLILYHLHKIDYFCMANFLKYFPYAQLLLILREPLQSCESWALHSLETERKNRYITYSEVGGRISSMLLQINSPPFKTQSSVAVRLEDIKLDPRDTMLNLCNYLGIPESSSLYESTMQGLKWWGDPSSTLYGRTQSNDSYSDDPIKKNLGELFSETDQMILQTLFYPLSARFGYVDEDQKSFTENLKKIKLLIEKPLDFEISLSAHFSSDYPNLEATGAFRSLHASFQSCWQILNEYGTYPNMVNKFPL